jgi:hypothetical protein
MPFRLCMPLCLLLSIGSPAQSTKKEKEAAALQQLKTAIDAKQYIFVAQTATSMGGRSRQLNGEYSLKIHNDSLDVDLPYYGRAYSTNPGDVNGGFRFRSTAFSYTIKDQKKGGWYVSIVPDNKKDATRIDLNISAGGYGTLQVSSTNRQVMSFYGSVRANHP